MFTDLAKIMVTFWCESIVKVCWNAPVKSPGQSTTAG